MVRTSVFGQEICFSISSASKIKSPKQAMTVLRVLPLHPPFLLLQISEMRPNEIGSPDKAKETNYC
ncbi:hypothetical protein H5410_012966 [Solanum commersonii]|uniref:Uncharacterized protein n=1 Tax=Solanum commersonii TaxID=4109 RepID=A0A9J6ATM9_SOLCO|nr:hypothetical protein H5410_012966 [Solanum commersonii]